MDPKLIKALRQQRATLLAEASALFSAAGPNGLDADGIKADDRITAELKDVDAQIVRAEAHMDRMRAAGEIITDIDARRDTKKFVGIGEQLVAVARAGLPGGKAFTDPRLIEIADNQLPAGIQAASGLSEGIAADGGFLVQTDFLPELLQNVYNEGEITQRIRKITVGANSNGIKMNGVDETSRVNGSRWGGIQAYWTGEAQLFTGTQPKFKKIGMELEKLTGLCYATSELLADSQALEGWLGAAFASEFTFKIEDAILNGTGAGMPLGILNSGCVITVNKEGSQVAATIVAENILKMWARMPARLRSTCVWLINQDTEPQLYQLNIKIKNVAGSENVGGIPISPWGAPGPVYVPPGTNGNSYGTLMGRPVVPVEYCATLGTAGDIILCDLSQYLAIDKGGINAQSSVHVRFLYDEMAFRFVYRFNGQPLWAAALTPYKGTSTQSPFIICQTR